MTVRIGIVGAGIGGLTAGALLAKEGYEVTIYEREPFLGGRALTIPALSNMEPDEYIQLLSRFCMSIPFSEPDLSTIFLKNLLKGYVLDFGYHAVGGGVKSTVNSVLAELGDHVDFLESYVGFIKERGYNFPFLSWFDKLKIAPNIFKLVFASEKTLRKLDEVSITETIDIYGRGKMKLILEVFSRSISTVNNLDKISTGEMFRSQRNLYRGSKPCGYPKNGLHSIHTKLAEYINKHGGTIHLQKPVSKIQIKGNKATGLLVDECTIPFDCVVSNILIQNLFSIADKTYFPPEYVKYLTSLQGTGSLCAYYALTEIPSDLVGKTFHFLERDIGVDGNDAVGMIDFMVSLPEAGLSPPSSSLVQSYIICTPEEAKNRHTLKKLKGLLDKNLERLIPNYHSKLIWALYPSIWHLDGVAKTIDNEKPTIVTPVENLFLVGDSVKATGIGVNCAINSALLLKKHILNTYFL